MKQNKKEVLDLIIIGAGPAGLTASIYASRYHISHVAIGKALGGMAATAHKVCNFPSEKEIPGFELMDKFRLNAESQGGKIISDEVVKVEKNGDDFLVSTVSGKEFAAKTILIAAGTERRRLGLANEAKFLGRGVSYCATCDGPLYKGKIAAVVGGSNSAITAALHLASFAEGVFLIYRRDKLGGEPAWVAELGKIPKIKIIYNTNVVGLVGETKLQKIILDRAYEGRTELDVAGLFVEIGAIPKTEIFEKLGVALDEKKLIKVKNDQSASLGGVWAAGDVTNGSGNFRQVITACSEGAIAAESIFKHLQLTAKRD